MNISDLIRALQHVQAEHGDLPVLERRPAGWDSSGLFPNGIEVDKRVTAVAAWQEKDCHHYDETRNVAAGARDRREFKAFIL